MLLKSHQIDLRKFKNGLRRYMLDRLYPKLDLDPVAFEISMPMWGSKSTALIVQIETGQKFFVRLYRPWQRKEAEKEKTVNELLASNEVSVPALVDYTDMPKRYYSIISVEKFLSGRPLTPEDYNGKFSHSLAEQLAEMHSIRRDSPGEPDAPTRRKEIFPRLLHRITNRLKRIRGHRVIDISKARKKIVAELKGFREPFQTMDQYNFTHDKIHGKNIIVPDQGQLAFIDFTTAHYSFLGKDLVTVHHNYCWDVPGRVEEFNKLYFAKMKPEEENLFRATDTFYHAWHHISRCAENCNAAKKCFRAGEGFGKNYQQKAQHEWNTALGILGLDSFVHDHKE